ncbi:hypothetical protein [Croceimicrobium sp.]|uniref:hypothetical protein n=1 Tax=Croceimicrobium sp. TaxID=2828340 RepID=UPI003BA93094
MYRSLKLLLTILGLYAILSKVYFIFVLADGLQNMGFGLLIPIMMLFLVGLFLFQLWGPRLKKLGKSEGMLTLFAASYFYLHFSWLAFWDLLNKRPDAEMATTGFWLNDLPNLLALFFGAWLLILLIRRQLAP